MKKIIAPMLVLMLLLTGCQTVVKESRSTEGTTKSSKSSVSTEATEPKNTTEATTSEEEPTEQDDSDGPLKKGKWNLTDVSYYSYEGQYVSKQNGYYMYDEYFKGDTDDGYVRFELYGGYQGPKYEDHTVSTANFVVECSNPEQYYAPGADVKLILRCQTDTEYGETHHDPARIYFSRGNGNATGDRFFGSSVGYFADKDGEDWTHKWNTSTELFAKFPGNAENGDEIAIVFSVPVGYDDWGAEYEKDYGGYMFYEWIYTYIAD